MSHRELTMLHAPQFFGAILDYKIVELLVQALFERTGTIRLLSADIIVVIVEFLFQDLVPIVHSSLLRRTLADYMDQRRFSQFDSESEFPFRICVRKRPLLKFERNNGTYDVVNTDSVNSLTLHDGRLARNGRQLTMTHHQYVFDRVFAADASNNQVCENAIDPLLFWSEKGHKSTVICFGQTGTGKTYTFNGALSHIANKWVNRCIRITFFEVRGKKCFDLLSNRQAVRLLSDENDSIQVRGAKQIVFGIDDQTRAPVFRDAEQLLSLLQNALLLRSSEETERNPISSRSHAICYIELLTCKTTIVDDVVCGHEYTTHGQITLVDLAGTVCILSY